MLAAQERGHHRVQGVGQRGAEVAADQGLRGRPMVGVPQLDRMEGIKTTFCDRAMCTVSGDIANLP